LTKDIYVIPYCEKFLDVVKTIKGYRILLTHIGLNEGKLESGISKVSNISLTHLKAFSLILAGHYHTPQFVENGVSKFYYAGSVSNLSWSDKNQTKRFLIYDDQTLEVESVPITGQIQYKEIVLDKVENIKQVLEEAERLKNNGHNVRIKKLIKEDIENSPGDILIIEKKEIDVTNRGITITQTLEEKLNKYLEIKQVPEDKRPQYLEILQKNNILARL
jgi:DNA repair exonuclease SbcCD nuclease subunit